MRLISSTLTQPISGTLEPELLTYVSGLTTPISDAQKVKVNDLILGLKSGLGIANLSDAFDVIQIQANETEEIALRNLVKSSNHAIKSGSPIFTAFKGFKGNKTTGYLNSGFDPFNDKDNYSLNSASTGVYLNSIDQSAEVAAFTYGARQGSTAYNLMMPIRQGQSPQRFINSSFANPGISSTTGIVDKSLYVMNRLNATESETYVSGTKRYLDALASTSIPNIGDLYLLGNNQDGSMANPTDAEIGLFFTGRGFTESEQMIINTVFEEYMVAINNKNQVKITGPAIIWTFDDSKSEHGDLTNSTRSVFKSKLNGDGSQTRCTHFVMTQDCIDQVNDSLTSQQVLDLYNEGFDMQCHTDTTGVISGLTEAQVAAKMELVDSFYTGLGMPKPTLHAYPGGSYDTNARYTVSKYRKIGRTIGNDEQMYTGYIPNQYVVRCALSTDGYSAQGNIDKINRLTDYAIANNSVFILYGHGVYHTSPSESVYPNPMKLSVIEATLDYAISAGCPIKTMKDIFTDNI